MTDRSTRFGGAAGTVVFHFLNPADWGSLLPASVAFGLILVLTAVGSFWLKLPFVLTLLLSTLAMSPVVGRLTLAAKSGDAKAGLLSRTEAGAVKGFVVRYAALNAVWIIPVSLVGASLLGSGLPTKMTQSPGSWLAAAPIAGALFLVLIAAVGSVAAHLVAARASSLAACLAPEPWQWLASRREELPALIALCVGGSLLFLGLTMPVFILLGALLARGSPNAGSGILGLGFFLGWSSIPVFVSRIVGTFVGDAEVAPAAATATAMGAPPPPSEPAIPSPVAERVDIQAALTRLTALAQVDVPGAIAQALDLRTHAPQSAVLATQLAKLHLRNNQVSEALLMGAEAISLAFAEGGEALAMDLFGQLRDHRKAIKLPAKDWDSLARAFLNSSRFAEAAWCFVASGSSGADATRWLKGMVSAADGAAKAGQLEVASSIYSHVIKAAPTTATADYCRAALARLKPKLKSKPAA
jgi:hypothetical protein